MKTHFVLITLLILVVSYVRFNSSIPDEQSVLGIQVPEDATVENVEYDLSNFYQAVQGVTNTQTDSTLKGGIVPHHTLAGGLIADLFSRINVNKIRTVILLSPNHWHAGGPAIVSSLSQWKTPMDDVKVNAALLESLVSKDVVTLEPDTVRGEHGIVELLPYIKYFLPSVSVVPLVVQNGLSLQQIDQYAMALAEIAKDPSVAVIGAFDFSHYQYPDVSSQKDEETEHAILNSDYEEILGFGNEHTDASSALALLLRVMETVDANAPGIIAHTNSANILGIYSSETTSYFEILFTK